LISSADSIGVGFSITGTSSAATLVLLTEGFGVTVGSTTGTSSSIGAGSTTSVLLIKGSAHSIVGLCKGAVSSIWTSSIGASSITSVLLIKGVVDVAVHLVQVTFLVSSSKRLPAHVLSFTTIFFR